MAIIVSICALQCPLLCTAKHLRQPPTVNRKKTSLQQSHSQLKTCHSACRTAKLHSVHLMIQTANGGSAKTG